MLPSGQKPRFDDYIIVDADTDPGDEPVPNMASMHHTGASSYPFIVVEPPCNYPAMSQNSLIYVAVSVDQSIARALSFCADVIVAGFSAFSFRVAVGIAGLLASSVPGLVCASLNTLLVITRSILQV